MYNSPVALVDACPEDIAVSAERVMELSGAGRELAASCLEQILAVSQLRSAHLRLPLDITFSGQADLGFAYVDSPELTLALTGCEEADLFCATLGPGPDDVVAAAPADMRAPLQAAAQAVLEAWAAALRGQLEQACAQAGLTVGPLLSPGMYQGFGRDYLRSMLSLFNAGRTLGVTVEAGDILRPRYTVAAVLGVSSGHSELH